MYAVAETGQGQCNISRQRNHEIPTVLPGYCSMNQPGEIESKPKLRNLNPIFMSVLKSKTGK